MSVRLRSTAVVITTAAALAVAGAVAAAGSADAAAAPHAPIAATTVNPTGAAAGWLAQQFQNSHHRASPSGTHFDRSYLSGGKTVWYFDGGTTADAIFALAASHTGKAKIGSVIDYFAGHVAEYTSVSDTSGAPGPSDGQLAKTALAAIVAGADPTSFGGYNLLQTLKTDECTAPSGSDTDYTVPVCPAVGAGRNIFSSVSESLVLLAEARGAATYGAKYAPSAAAIAYFLSLQCPDGGFTGLTAACTDDADASVDETGYAAMALAAIGGHQAEATRALDWLAQNRSAHGYWVAQGGPDVDSTALASAALAAAGRDVSASRGWLRAQMVTEGPTVGTYSRRGALRYQGTFDRSESLKATADGVLGLARNGSLATVSAASAVAGTRVLRPAPGLASPAVVHGDRLLTVRAGAFTGGEYVRARLVQGRRHLAVHGMLAGKMGNATWRMRNLPLRDGAARLVLTGSQSGLRTVAAFTVTGK